jgi:hypothetical protein
VTNRENRDQRGYRREKNGEMKQVMLARKMLEAAPTLGKQEIKNPNRAASTE